MKKFFILFSILLSVYTIVHADSIHKYEESIPISDSITLTKVDEFYSDHNISYSYIKADLTNPNTSLKLLTSENGSDALDTVSNLAATNESTVAAMNADFFSWYSGNKGFSLGIEIKDGTLIQSPINPSTMATVSYENNTAAISYLDFHIMAVAPNGQYSEIRHLNKHTSYYGDILMYTKDFNGGYSPAPGGEVLEVVVSGGKITEFRRNQPSVQIPEDGCVLVVSEGSTMFFANNFNIGDEIKFDYYITPALYNAETAFGGGAMLVSDGKLVSKYSHVISGYQPRSAIGTDKSGTTLYMVAVNGRQTGSRGMTMSELAKLMLSLGCHNAVNLDGGGSTNMVASTVWYEKMHTVNSPTENRKVINAVGLSYTGTQGEPAGILLEPEANSVFIGQPVKITSAIHDANKRPINGEITWTSQYGTVENGVFTPNTGGNAIVTATCQNASSNTEIFVVDKIIGINTAGHIQLGVGEQKALDMKVFDEFGHYVDVKNFAPFDIISSDTSVVDVSGGTLTGIGNGTAIITIKKDNAVSYVSVVVVTGIKVYEDNFETSNGSFVSYPTYVGGAYSLSSEQYHSGTTSGKLSYDFSSETDEAKGAYFSLSNKISLDNSCNEISVFFYTPTAFNHELRAQFKDGNGKIYIVSFGKNYKTGTWQQLTASIPSDAVRPLSLDRIYVLYTSGETRDSGYIYIDDLSFSVSDSLKYVSPPANSYSTQMPTSGYSGTFAVGRTSYAENTFLAKHINSKTRTYVSFADTSRFIGELSGFAYFEDANALYITLDTSKGGIRNTNSSQWDSMKNAISNSSKKNIFILSNTSVFGSSEYENKVFQDYLSSLGRNVFVIYADAENSYKSIGNVQYFTLGNEADEILSTTHINNFKYLEFYFGENTTFLWKSLY